MYWVDLNCGIAFAIGGSTRTGLIEDCVMWNLFNCYLSGRHDYGMWCEPGQIFLRCMHCGKRSSGWSVGGKEEAPSVHASHAVVAAAHPPARVVPFTRAATS